MDKQQLSRRAFLKLAAASSTGAALAGMGPLRNIAAAQDTVELTFGRHWEAAFRPRQAEYDEGFMERHPEIEISITYNTWSDHNNVVPAWAAAGTLPDIIYVHGSRATPWAHEGIIIDIHELATADEEFDVDDIWEESLRMYRYKGRLHGIPYDHGPSILGYNADMFDAAGMDYPSEDWTFDDLREAAIALTNADELYWGWSGGLDMGNVDGGFHLGGWGGETLNEDETEMILDTPESHEALQFWYDLLHVDKAAPTASESEGFMNGPWQSGRIAMSTLPTWSTPSMRQFATFNWDVAPVPWGPAGKRKCGGFGSGYGITGDSEAPDAAWTYLREYLSLDGMIFMWSLSGRGSPARPGGLEAWLDSDPAPPSGRYYLEAMQDYAVTGPPFKSLASPQVLDVLGREAGNLRNADTTVEAAIDDVMRDAQAALDTVADE